jgi:hypothetical protein
MSEFTDVAPLPLDHPARKHLIARLAQRMSDISEDHCFASWLQGTEFFLWRAIQGGPRDFGIYRELSDEELNELKELSDLVGGWHDFNRFIPIDEWRLLAFSSDAVR